MILSQGNYPVFERRSIRYRKENGDNKRSLGNVFSVTTADQTATKKQTATQSDGLFTPQGTHHVDDDRAAADEARRAAGAAAATNGNTPTDDDGLYVEDNTTMASAADDDEDDDDDEFIPDDNDVAKEAQRVIDCKPNSYHKILVIQEIDDRIQHKPRSWMPIGILGHLSTLITIIVIRNLFRVSKNFIS